MDYSIRLINISRSSISFEPSKSLTNAIELEIINMESLTLNINHFTRSVTLCIIHFRLLEAFEDNNFGCSNQANTSIFYNFIVVTLTIVSQPVSHSNYNLRKQSFLTSLPWDYVIVAALPNFSNKLFYPNNGSLKENEITIFESMPNWN